MEYQEPIVVVIDKEIVESLLPIYETGCHCTSGGSRVCYSAGAAPIPG